MRDNRSCQRPSGPGPVPFTPVRSSRIWMRRAQAAASIRDALLGGEVGQQCAEVVEGERDDAAIT